jgi:tetratricopeptide (TPR) repeat protein
LPFAKKHQKELDALMNAFDKASDDICHIIWQAQASNQIGYWHLLHGNYKEAIEYFVISKEKFLASYNQTHDAKTFHHYAKQSGNISRSYLHWGFLDSAMKYQKICITQLDTCSLRSLINIANQIETKGIILMKQGKYDSAIIQLETSQDMRNNVGDYLGVAMCLDGLGEIFRLQGRFDKAIEVLNEAVKMKKSLKLSVKDPNPTYFQLESLSISYLQLGHLFYDWEKYPQALSYYDTSLSICRDIQYQRGEIDALRAMADVYITTDNNGEAGFLLNKALGISRKTLNKPHEAYIMKSIAFLFREQNQADSAIKYYDLSRKILDEAGFKNDLPEILLESGLIHLQLKQIGEAYDDLTQSFSLAKEIGNKKTLLEVSKVLASLYSEAHNYEKAFYYLNIYTRLKDSVFKIETHKQLADMQALYQNQQKQQQIELLENKNSLSELQIKQSRYVNFSLGGLILFILLFAILFLRQIKIRNDQKALIFQQQLLRSQINPHFIFNSLTNIQNFIFKNDPLSAGKYLSSFAKLMRNILDNSREERITLEKETETLKQYLDLQKLRMGDKLEYEFIVNDKIDIKAIIVPPMLSQPFIENAIEHGIKHKEGKGKVSIQIEMENNILEFSIADNGVGRDKAREIEKSREKKHRSLAMKITRERLEALRKKTRSKIRFEIIDLKDDDGNSTGTRVVFGVPVKA